MDEKGYAFTPLVFLMFIPIIILAVSYSGIVNEINAISSIAIGGDVTNTVATNIIEAIQEDTADAGRNAAYNATRQVIDNYNLYNDPFFGQSPSNDSESYILNYTVNMINLNVTNTCRQLENQTGRNITINGVAIDENGTSSDTIFQTANMSIYQTDPFGFYITVNSANVTVTQNSTTANQSVSFQTPTTNSYVSILQLEDPYIWVSTYGHNSSVFYEYPYYTQASNIIGGNASDSYHFDEQVSAGNLNYLNQCLVGPNPGNYSYMPYYFPDPDGLTFFDRLDNRTNNTSTGPNSAKMATFILWNPNYANIPGYTPSEIDYEYFQGINGTSINTTHGTTVTTILGPDGNVFYLSSAAKAVLGLLNNYNY